MNTRIQNKILMKGNGTKGILTFLFHHKPFFCSSYDCCSSVLFCAFFCCPCGPVSQGQSFEFVFPTIAHLRCKKGLLSPCPAVVLPLNDMVGNLYALPLVFVDFLGRCVRLLNGIEKRKQSK